jgi:hypothetical protein
MPLKWAKTEISESGKTEFVIVANVAKHDLTFGKSKFGNLT